MAVILLPKTIMSSSTFLAFVFLFIANKMRAQYLTLMRYWGCQKLGDGQCINLRCLPSSKVATGRILLISIYIFKCFNSRRQCKEYILSAVIQALGKNAEQILQDKENCIRPCILWRWADRADTQSKAAGAVDIL